MFKGWVIDTAVVSSIPRVASELPAASASSSASPGTALMSPDVNRFFTMAGSMSALSVAARRGTYGPAIMSSPKTTEVDKSMNEGVETQQRAEALTWKFLANGAMLVEPQSEKHGVVGYPTLAFGVRWRQCT